MVRDGFASLFNMHPRLWSGESARGGRGGFGSRKSGGGGRRSGGGGDLIPASQQLSAGPEPEPQAAELPQPAEASLSPYDFTAIPARLDAQFERLDSDAAMRPTTIKAGKLWRKSSLVSTVLY